jgi:hypothetical protein
VPFLVTPQLPQQRIRWFHNVVTHQHRTRRNIPAQLIPIPHVEGQRLL